MHLRQCKPIIVSVANDVMNNNILSFAAALSYYFVLAFFPALIALAAFVAYLPIPNPLDTIMAAMARVAPPESMPLIARTAADVLSPSRGALLSAGLIGTLWTCSSGFSAAIEALNVAYDVTETRPFWKTRLLALELTFLIGTLATVAFGCVIAGSHLDGFLATHFGLFYPLAFLWPILRYLLVVIFIVIAVEALYVIAPNLEQRFISSLPGAILVVVGWIFLSAGLSFYFRHLANLNRTYGVLGGGIALLIWLYWVAFLVLLGAELNSEILHQRGKPNPVLKPPSSSNAPRPLAAKQVRPGKGRPPLQ
jgi:membrane protein